MKSSTQKAQQLLQRDGSICSNRTHFAAILRRADQLKLEFKGQLESNADHDRWCREQRGCYE